MIVKSDRLTAEGSRKSDASEWPLCMIVWHWW